MLNELYPENGTALVELALGRRPHPRQIFKVLEADYHVPHNLIEVLCESFGRAVAEIVDEAVDQKRIPQSYFIVRHLAGDWLP